MWKWDERYNSPKFTEQRHVRKRRTQKKRNRVGAERNMPEMLSQ